jgi:PAS domain S-box-containing protein
MPVVGAVGVPDVVANVLEAVSVQDAETGAGVDPAGDDCGLDVWTIAVDAVDASAVAAVDAVVCGTTHGHGDALAAVDGVRDVAPGSPVVFVPSDPAPATTTRAVDRDVDAYATTAQVRADPMVLVDVVASALDVDDSTLDLPGAPFDADARSVDGRDGTAPDDGATGFDEVDDDAGDGTVDVDAPLDGSREAVFRRLVELSADAMFVADGETLEVTYANTAAGDILGYDHDALVGTPISALHPADARELLEEVPEVMKSGGVHDHAFESRGGLELLTADGRRVPVAITTEPVVAGEHPYVVATFRDVSDQRERIVALERTERRLRNVTNAAFDIVFRTDADSAFEAVSGSVEATLGYTETDLLGESFASIIAPVDVEHAWEAFERTRDGEVVEEVELRIRSTGGRHRILRVNAIPVFEDDEFRGVDGVARDVTARYHRERLLSVLNRVLRHNLRNATTVLDGHASALADLVEADAGDADAVATHVDEIRDTTADLVGLGEKAARLRSAVENKRTTTEVDAAAAVRAAVDATGVDAACEIEGSATVAVGGELEMAVRELLVNAVQHAGVRPRVRVRVADRHVEVRVADDGSGLPAQDRHVLEGESETPLQHGSGLGLWLVNWVTTAAGGDVDVETDDDGTTVRLWLPRVGG